MPAFFLSLLACALATLAGREGLRVARLAGASRGIAGIVAAGVLASILSTAFAVWLGSSIAPLLAAEAKQIFVAIALLFSAIEIALLRPAPAPREPTPSIGATFLALLAVQVTDAARFLVMALAVLTADPIFAASGGALGSAAALVLVALAGSEWERRVPLAVLRYFTVAALALAGIAIGLSALHLL